MHNLQKDTTLKLDLNNRARYKSPSICSKIKGVETISKVSLLTPSIVRIDSIQGMLFNNESLTYSKLSSKKIKIKKPWLCSTICMNMRTHDFCFFQKEDIVDLFITIYGLRKELAKKDQNYMKPGLLRIKLIKCKMEYIAKKQGLSLKSLMLVIDSALIASVEAVVLVGLEHELLQSGGEDLPDSL